MTHNSVEPEVAGGLGANTVLDRSRHPPVVQRLHYEFEGWLGDVLLESFPAFIVTEEARQALVQEGVTGARFDEVEVSLFDTFRETQPRTTLPRFVWLRPEGEPGRDDIATARDGARWTSRASGHAWATSRPAPARCSQHCRRARRAPRAMRLSLEVREGVSSEERPVAEPDADKARAALRSLDGARISQLAADDGRGQVLLIGGGNEGRFVVDCLADLDEHGYHLVDPDGMPEEIAVVTGGQLASFPGDRMVSEALAAEALVHFVATGRRAESLIWRQEF